ncbi:MAG: metal-sulfur cluster biosynthetic enzyme [Ignavibacteriales bacterium CG_4_9_14_3_um_filter_34_10]|nr:MAG: metal-sulfur cluster biosynthetic enzyme [Ignavibacteriales bacterium CG_4_9_14_3_um_filter_34_10]
MTKQDILNELEKVGHPAINYSLIKLGIVNDVELNDNKVSVVFAFPFPNIPIADALVNSIARPVKSMGLNFDYKIRIMTEEEKGRFLQLETEAWKG